ncbi:outer membrane protein [Labrys monachus]|uniref:Outer membrane immunogenic protein n=1 Tax=Labrys monachus TaxID=217067 RepID=A0ABU0FM30_9HYPH|nr:outer membrane protein [Labrys monachus]MDQ0395660.1 outer membrane immunogenic protein [Labrys monachus]
MQSFKYALFAIMASTTSVFAADLPQRAEPVAPAAAVPFSWTGFYVGAQGGYQWTDASGPLGSRPDFSQGMPYSNHPESGFIGGHVGYNYQYDSFVVGIEGDANAAFDDKDTDLVQSPVLGQPPFRIRTKQDWNADIRLRLGYAIDRFLPYIAGGVAFGDVKTSYEPTSPLLFGVQNNTNRTGWTIGAGLEYAVTDNITARIEYRYTDFGKKNFSYPSLSYYDKVKFTTNAVLFGVSYKF